MKNIYFLPIVLIALFLSSCSAYHQDMVYSKKINTQEAFLTHPINTPIVASSVETTPLVVQETETNHSIAQAPSKEKVFLKKQIAKTEKLVSKIATASPIQIVIGKKSSVTVQKEKLANTAARITSNGLFMILFSMFVMIISAIIVFAGINAAQNMVILAGIVLLLVGMLLFVLAVARIIAKSGLK